MSISGVFKIRNSTCQPLCLDIFLAMEFSVLHRMGDENDPNDTAGRRGHELYYIWPCPTLHPISNSNSNSKWTFIALNLPKQEDSKAQQNKKQSTKFCVQGHNRGRTPRRTPGG